MEKEYNRSPQEVLEELGSCPTGLTEAEAAERLAKHGPNKLKEAEKPSLLQRFLTQPFIVAETFSGKPGVFVTIEETVRGFKEILEGKYDDLPEQAFYMTGSIDDVLRQAEEIESLEDGSAQEDSIDQVN